MRSLPFDTSGNIFLDSLAPLQLHSVIGQMKYVAVTSLHASIFAFSQNVPFISVHQDKVEHYFADRGLGSNVVKSRGELLEQLHRFDSERPDYSELIEADRSTVMRAFARYAEILAASPAPEGAWASAPVTPQRRQDAMLLDQAKHVISDRDLALSHSESQRLELKRQVESLSSDLHQVQERLDTLLGSRSWRIAAPLRWLNGAAHRLRARFT
jgi:hypothetical protein